MEYYEGLATTIKGAVDAVNSVDPCSNPGYALGSLGASLGIFFANAGAAYGIATSFYGYVELAKNPKTDRLLLIKGLIPGVMASVRGVYGLIIAILITTQMNPASYSFIKGIAHFMAGMCVGLTGVASGYCMGVIGDSGLKSVSKKPILFTAFLLMLVFCEAIGLFGLIIALILTSQAGGFHCD